MLLDLTAGFRCVRGCPFKNRRPWFHLPFLGCDYRTLFSDSERQSSNAVVTVINLQHARELGCNLQ